VSNGTIAAFDAHILTLQLRIANLKAEIALMEQHQIASVVGESPTAGSRASSAGEESEAHASFPLPSLGVRPSVFRDADLLAGHPAQRAIPTEGGSNE